MKEKLLSLLQIYKINSIEAGCDEAGRGCLAGPVTAAAVVLPPDFSNNLLNDSKQLSEKQRNLLREVIEKEALAYAVEFTTNEEIDKLNILRASIFTMHKCLNKIKADFNHIIIDGNRFYPYKKVQHTCIVKGDAKYYSIAAASILAKTYRDEFMDKIDMEYPRYNWKKNKGYPTKEHRQAIAEFGITPYHRKSFRLLPEQLKLKF